MKQIFFATLLLCCFISLPAFADGVENDDFMAAANPAAEVVEAKVEGAEAKVEKEAAKPEGDGAKVEEAKVEAVPADDGKFIDDEDLDSIDEMFNNNKEQPKASDISMLQTAQDAPEADKEASKPEVAADGGISSGGLVDSMNQGAAAPENGGTWIEKLKNVTKENISKAKEEKEETLEGMVNKSKSTGAKSKRTNAAVLDISGVMLRMSLAQVEQTLQNRGYKKIHEKMEIPNFIKWRNEELCRNSGVVGYERLANCVIKIAQKDKHEYVASVKYAKFDTKEEIKVNFTSNFTNNKAYKALYSSLEPTITGNSQKALYIRNVKVYDFWQKINQKYGAPDDKDSVIWGMGDNKPYLQAATGKLLLEDPMLRELDYTRMSREDKRYLHTNLYNF